MAKRGYELPTGVRILFVGSRHLPKEYKQLALTIGRELMRLDTEVPIRLITGGSPECDAADRHVVAAASEVLSTPKKIRVSILTYAIRGREPGRDDEHFGPTRNVSHGAGARQQRRFRMVDDADAVIALGGTRRGGTRDAINLALALDKPVLPFPIPDSTAERAWKNSRDRAAISTKLRIDADNPPWASTVLTRPSAAGLKRHVRRSLRYLVDAIPMRCFVIMTYDDPDDRKIYKHVVKPAIEQVSMIALRADREGKPGVAVANMRDMIRSSHVIVGILTHDERASGVNPNVSYEIGFAHSQDLPVLLLSNIKPEQLPFDLKSEQILPVPQSYDAESLTRDVAKQITRRRGPRRSSTN